MKKILIVDNDKFTRYFCRQILTENLFSVKTASSSEEALNILDHTFDLVLTDLEIQGFDGLWLARKIRMSHKGAIPVILMTQSLYEWQIAQAEDLGVSDIVLKPFNADTLVSMVSRNVR